jgi:WD40 repeat protein
MQDQAFCPVEKLGSRIAWAAGKSLVVYNFESNTFELNVDNVEGHTDAVRGISFAPSGLFIVTAGEDKKVILWILSAENRWEQTSVYSHNKKIMTVDFLDESSIVFGDKFGDFFKIKIENESIAEQEAEILFGHLAAVTAAVSIPGRNLLVSADRDEKIRLTEFPKYWDIASFLFGHKRYVSSLCLFDTEGTKVVSAGADGLVSLWDISDANSPKQVWSVQLEDGPINSVTVANGDVLVVRTETPNKIIRIRDGQTCDTVEITEEAQALCVCADGRIAFVDNNSHLRFIDGSEPIKIALDVEGIPVSLMKFIHHENLDGTEYGKRKRERVQTNPENAD